MRKTKIFLIFIFLFAFHNFQFSDSLTRVYINGKVFTGVKDTLNEAFVIRGGRILFTGGKEKALRFSSGKKSNIIDLKGKTVIPGFHDADINFPLGAGLMDSDLNFYGLDLDSILHRLKEKKKNLVNKNPIYGYNFEHLLREKGKWPNKYDLDKVSDDSPIVIFSSDGNNAWVNSLVLKQSGVNKNTYEIPGGRIVRFEDNNPTGILCGNSTRLLFDFNFSKGLQSIKLNKKKILKAVKYATSLGITSVTTQGDLEFVNILNELESDNMLNLRFNIILPSKNIGGYLIKKINFNSGTPFVRIISVSKDIDGNLYTSDAAMFSSYSDRNYYGFLRSNK
ncbi:MAG: amidohydrolase family protein, partial [Candidatus Aminicenantes bacterium]|nr:amidohydrolase family protein [Candidatus Aminicenantes bacterium]